MNLRCWLPVHSFHMRALRSLAFLCIAIGGVAAEPALRVPRTATVPMIDGKLSVGEWSKAAQIEVPGIARLYFKQAAGFVYIAVEFTSAPSGIVDLYLAPDDGHIYDLHASAKLGERELKGDGWPEWNWWNNRDWIANVSRVDSWEKRAFLPQQVREYQILRSRFPASAWRLRFELTAMTPKNETLSVTVFPARTSDHNPSDWLTVQLQ